MKKSEFSKNQVILLFILTFIIECFGIWFLPSNLWRIFWFFLLSLAMAYVAFRVYKELVLEKDEVINYTNQHAQEAMKDVLETLPAGIVRYDRETKDIIWMNPYTILAYSDTDGQMTKADVEMIFQLIEDGQSIITIGDKQYYFYVHEQEGLIYFLDVSGEQRIKQEMSMRQSVIGIIQIDNYDDGTEKMDEKEISVMNSKITSIISDWARENKMFYRKISAEKFFFFSQYRSLEKMMNEKFPILEEFKTMAKESETPFTLSIGISYGIGNTANTGDVAINNLDVALVRGGDQVVVKEDTESAKPIYFGGKTASVVKRTRVRTRAMATALKGIMQESDQIFVMGHKMMDMDAFGSAIGVAYLGRNLGKPAYVIYDENQELKDVGRAKALLNDSPQIFDSLISPEMANQKITENSLLVMVDHSKPSLTLNEKVFQAFSKVVIIDHHRRGDEFPKNPLLSYIESGASSASELVTELIQFQSRSELRLSRLESTILLAGIIVDTKNFMVRATSRTFDVASFLKSMGADTNQVQNLLANDLDNFLEINQLISAAKFIRPDTVVSCGEDSKIYNSVTTAKAADTLLSMSGINASFVITRRDQNTVGISARSQGSINVQLIMEAIGGGGHFNNAAVQCSDQTVEAVKNQLEEIIEDKAIEIYGNED
ncbi:MULTISPECIES: DHH family phosphoesterase [unclassified Enterococcus]|uniref:DHH family phosphoesterase n=1 Tax=unclassified Enterococcus TaxID=2608891 RepID=UPI0015577938|nr:MULTISPECIES: DHH family phosphoesterase [unclassified Enterococcus]MBS7578041.1 DHH family phosphoesterase [Enterococcus sp. MMGLQ5-2]MBS7585269.1 DHH family phosphoesterase [Enterococcus sp. MMGLQ5-1]NPD13126.1 DHH family phosphoesterase [Enterococcus sp. MMGLQ5-1]NPD37872.1 DHH family phosphoesterase [Enterococcus sp. MMGLQ5-2]